jgi:hypothetical protein
MTRFFSVMFTLHSGHFAGVVSITATYRRPSSSSSPARAREHPLTCTQKLG